MTATQTGRSASLVLLLVGSTTVTAQAEPAEPCAQPVGEASDDAEGPVPCRAPDPPPRPPTGRFEIGAGFATDTGFLATARIAQDDLFRTGIQLSLDALISARDQRFGLHVGHPHVLGSDLALSADLYNDLHHYSWYDRERVGGSVTASRPLTEHLRGFVGYRLEQVQVEADPLLASGRAIDPQPGLLRGGLLSAVRAGMVYSTLDNEAAPMRGTRLGAWLEVADRRLGSDVELARAHAWGSHHRPLGPFTLHVGGSATAVTTSDPLGVPLSERLQLDGWSELRGYRPEALGPVDMYGRPIGGTVKLTGRGELELPVIPSAGISIAGFVDGAAVYDPSGQGGYGTSVGLGIRWRSPIGLLRFDWAVPLGREDRVPRFGFSIGF